MPSAQQRLNVDDGDVTNTWTMSVDRLDTAGWSNDDGSANPCGGTRDQVISWGGPVATYRWDTWRAVDVKYLSIREITP